MNKTEIGKDTKNSIIIYAQDSLTRLNLTVTLYKLKSPPFGPKN